MVSAYCKVSARIVNVSYRGALLCAAPLCREDTPQASKTTVPGLASLVQVYWTVAAMALVATMPEVVWRGDGERRGQGADHDFAIAMSIGEMTRARRPAAIERV